MVKGQYASLRVSTSDAELEHLVTRCVNEFFKRKLELLRTFRFRESLHNVNPCILKITASGLASEIVVGLLNAHMNVRDETIFREVFSEAVASVTSGGKTSLNKLVRAVKLEATEYEEKFEIAWARAVNRFTAQFLEDFCSADGAIDWEKLARLYRKESSGSLQ